MVLGATGSGPRIPGLDDRSGIGTGPDFLLTDCRQGFFLDIFTNFNFDFSIDSTKFFKKFSIPSYLKYQKCNCSNHSKSKNGNFTIKFRSFIVLFKIYQTRGWPSDSGP